MTSIHPLAIVEPGAELGVGVQLAAHAIVRAGTRLGDGVRVDSFAVVGGDPQDLRFDPRTPSGVEIGAGSWIREHVTVNRSTKEGGLTRVGARTFLMAAAHVAHDCTVGDDVVIANAVLLAGHVTIGPRAFLGGSSVYHQFCRVGELAMISGNASIAHDVPPFTMAAERNQLHGLNLIGLRRAGLAAAVGDLKACYRAVFLTPGAKPKLAAAARAAGLGTTEPGARFLAFVEAAGKRGFVHSTREGRAAGAAADAGDAS